MAPDPRPRNVFGYMDVPELPVEFQVLIARVPAERMAKRMELASRLRSAGYLTTDGRPIPSGHYAIDSEDGAVVPVPAGNLPGLLRPVPLPNHLNGRKPTISAKKKEKKRKIEMLDLTDASVPYKVMKTTKTPSVSTLAHPAFTATLALRPKHTLSDTTVQSAAGSKRADGMRSRAGLQTGRSGSGRASSRSTTQQLVSQHQFRLAENDRKEKEDFAFNALERLCGSLERKDEALGAFIVQHQQWQQQVSRQMEQQAREMMLVVEQQHKALDLRAQELDRRERDLRGSLVADRRGVQDFGSLKSHGDNVIARDQIADKSGLEVVRFGDQGKSSLSHANSPAYPFHAYSFASSRYGGPADPLNLARSDFNSNPGAQGPQGTPTQGDSDMEDGEIRSPSLTAHKYSERARNTDFEPTSSWVPSSDENRQRASGETGVYYKFGGITSMPGHGSANDHPALEYE